MYYFDISFEETVRRHNIRKTEHHSFGPEDMREWYPVAHRSNHRLEQIIPETSSLEETIEFIKQTSGLCR